MPRASNGGWKNWSWLLVPLHWKSFDFLSMGMNESKEGAAKIREEYRSMFSSFGNCSSRRIVAAGRAEREQGTSQERKLLWSQRWKATIRKIAEQVQAETEQWSQVQEMLYNVREEMEDLQKSRDFWEDHALPADEKVATLQVLMHDWRGKAHLSEIKISELQLQDAQLRHEIEVVRHRHAVEQTRWLDARHTRKLLSSNSVTSLIGVSDMHLESLDNQESLTNQEASAGGAEMSNQPTNREKAAEPDDDENRNEKNNMQMVKPRISKAGQISHKCRHKNSIKKASELCEVHRNQQSSSKHLQLCEVHRNQQLSSKDLQQKDCGMEQLSQKITNKKVQADHCKGEFPLQVKHPHRELKKLGKQFNALICQ